MLTWHGLGQKPAYRRQAGLAESGVVNVGKEVTVCVVVTRGGSSDEQPTGCWPAKPACFRDTSVSQVLKPENGGAGRSFAFGRLSFGTGFKPARPRCPAPCDFTPRASPQNEV